MRSESILRALVEKTFTKKIWKRLMGLVNKVLSLTKKVWKRLMELVNKVLSLITVRIMSLLTPVNKNKIIFLTFRGSYDCNPKWICEEILRRDLPYQLSWSYKKRSLTNLEDFPESLELVRQGSLEFFRDLCSARIIIDNAFLMSVMRYKKKRNQCLIETWHGSMGIKRISKDVVKDKRWLKKAIREGRMTDYLISNSDFESKIFRDSYWEKTPIWKYGHARNDILFGIDVKDFKRIRNKIFGVYGLSDDTKICLYAPTFRDDNNMAPYTVDYEGLTSALKERFGGEWVVFTRFHFKVVEWMKKKKIVLTGQNPNVIDVNSYPDIQELAACTDAAITDYSSWICEYMLTRRPGFLFVPDILSYIENERSFYYPLDTLPFSIAENNGQLIQNILSFDSELYAQKCNIFLREKGSVDDGCAAGRIVDKIEEIMRGD